MKFDTVIIGGGLSGLICGISLSKKGQRCAIISSGQSALHFSSGSFDLLNKLPNGEEVSNPLLAIDTFIEQQPKHPYAKLGTEKFKALTQEAIALFKDLNIPVVGNTEKNHYRVTPMGTLKPTWLSLKGCAVIDEKDKLPWKKVSIFNIDGFLDFQPQFIADEFSRLGTDSSSIQIFDFEPLSHLRRNPSEMRSTNIARVLDKHIEELSEIINQKSNDSEVVLFPACIGLTSNAVYKLKELVSKPILLIATMPPSIVGIHTQQYLHDYFISLGGVYMLGDNVMKADVEDNKVKRIYSYNHGDIPFSADNFVLATGSYFSQGLIATSDCIYEPIFDLDIDYATNRTEWYSENMFEAQNYQRYGVKTDNQFKAVHKGKAMDNLYVSGAILEEFNPIKEGSGAGVSILSALEISHTISQK